MEELLEKPKRIRRKKELPPFSVERKGGEIRNIPIELNNNINYSEHNDNLISPYTEFIPLVYMLYDGVMCRGEDNASKRASAFRDLGKDWIEKLEKRNKHNPIEHLYRRAYGSGKKKTTERVREYINSYIMYDDSLSISSMHSHYTKSGVFDTIMAFRAEERSWFACQFHMRSYNGLVSPFSLIIRNGDREYSPHILAVIPPENFIYMKYEWLLTGNIDLSKIVILIDRELDNTEFPNKPFRALYKKEIQPYLETLNTTIAKVPIEYIKEKCFVGKYKLKSRNIIERKKEIEKITENFISSIAAKGEENGVVSQGIYQQILNAGNTITVNGEGWSWAAREPSPYIIQTGSSTSGNTEGLGVSFQNNERVRDLQMQYNIAMNESMNNQLGLSNEGEIIVNSNNEENSELVEGRVTRRHRTDRRSQYPLTEQEVTPVVQERSIEDESPW